MRKVTILILFGSLFGVGSCGQQTRQHQIFVPSSVVSVDSTIKVLPEKSVGSTVDAVRAGCPQGVSSADPNIEVGPSGGYFLVLSWSPNGAARGEWEITMGSLRPDGTYSDLGRRPYLNTDVRQYRSDPEMQRGRLYRFELAARPEAPAFGRVIYRTYTVDLRGL